MGEIVKKEIQVRTTNEVILQVSNFAMNVCLHPEGAGKGFFVAEKDGSVYLVYDHNARAKASVCYIGKEIAGE